MGSRSSTGRGTFDEWRCGLLPTYFGIGLHRTIVTAVISSSLTDVNSICHRVIISLIIVFCCVVILHYFDRHFKWVLYCFNMLEKLLVIMKLVTQMYNKNHVTLFVCLAAASLCCDKTVNIHASSLPVAKIKFKLSCIVVFRRRSYKCSLQTRNDSDD